MAFDSGVQGEEQALGPIFGFAEEARASKERSSAKN